MTLTSGVVVSTDPDKRSAQEEKAYRDEIARLDTLGELDSEAQARMGLVAMSGENVAERASGSSDLDRRTSTPARAGAPAVALACSVNDAATSATDMTLYAPKIYVNYSSQGYIMYADSKFQWSSPPASGSTCVVPVGGPDGFAFAFNKSVTNLGVSFYTCNYYNKCTYNYGWLETNGSYGAGYAFQDQAAAWPGGYGSAYKGTITYAFRTSTSSCTQAFSKYAHTWNSTSVNGFSIGPWSIGVQWSSSSSQWLKSSQAGSYGSC